MTASMAQLDISPLREGLTFGVRIKGITRQLTEDVPVRAVVNAAFERAGLIVFEEVEQSDAMQVALSNMFGPLKEHPVAALTRVNADTMPGVIQIRQLPHSGNIVEIGGKRLTSWLPWHFDHCYNNELNRAGILRAVVIADEGGRTGFTDGIALYKALSPTLRTAIEDKEILYTLDTQYDTMRFGRPKDFAVIERKNMQPGFEENACAMPRAIHPAVWTRASGEKVLHVSPWMSAGIAGAETPEGDALLEAVCQEINRLAAENSYHHQWRPTDMVIWDNWRVLHSVSGNPPSLARTMYRTTIKGDYGLGRFEHNGQGGKILEMTV
jgi:taurine dioxygenase